jgi:Na+/melibiose symporter-like transporter
MDIPFRRGMVSSFRIDFVLVLIVLLIAAFHLARLAVTRNVTRQILITLCLFSLLSFVLFLCCLLRLLGERQSRPSFLGRGRN